MSLGLDTLIERGVLANERIAAALEKLVAAQEPRVQVVLTPETPAVAAVEPEKPKRGRKPKEETVVAAAEAAKDAAEASAKAPAPKSFLDEDEPATEAAPAVVELTPKEKYDKIRAGLIQTQNAQGPDAAFKILKDVGGAEILRDLKVENYDKVLVALTAAQAKK